MYIPHAFFCMIMLTCMASTMLWLVDIQMARSAKSSSKNISSSSSRGRGALDWGSPLRRCTDSLLVLNGLMFILQWASKDVLMLWGAKVNALITAGQWWRLLTSSFLHTSAIHLLVSTRASRLEAHSRPGSS